MNKLLSRVAIGALLLALIGGVDINVTPNMNYHTLLKPQIVTTKSYRIFGTAYNINLGDELEGAEAIQTVLTTIQSAGRYDKIVFHIKGYGGSVDGLFAILNAIEATEASVLMSVEGNSSSAYASLATSGFPLVMAKHAFLMFHMGSINGIDCSKKPGLFDGIPASESCQNAVDAYTKELTDLVLDNKVLTFMEKLTILSGHEVYLHSSEVIRRIHHEKSKH